ncbi:hypothetical protein PG999_001414 [Apiospora kogelbergensis]|uniref:Geranylgeranyl pyrophosphate synthase n=1 Tax=Apiospora kogelbergensis TaxID=1337665 RepID=A0AAW0REC9_9PEZI
MPFNYSTIVNPASYETEGLCDGIDVRLNDYSFLEDRGAIRAHQDWNNLVAPCSEYRGTLGPRFNFISTTIPECFPDRLEILSYANDFAFLHDDHIDDKDFQKVEAENDDMMAAFLEAANTERIATRSSEGVKSGKKKIQAQIFLEMLAIDPECAKTTMKAWARFVEVGSSRQHNTRFTSLAEYIPYRIMDVGEMFWYGLVTFGLGLHIPDEELELCRKLTAPAWISVSLQNDLWSWPKERDAAEEQGQSHVINALWVLMQERQVDIDTAEKICRDLIKEYVAEYRKIWEQNQFNDSISVDLRKYMECMLYSISGNVVWSLGCPRYHPEISFNEKQLDWMQNGVPDLDQLIPESSSDTSITHTTSGSEAESTYTVPPGSPLEVKQSYDDSDRLREERELVEAAFEYISAMPSKGCRERFIDGLNAWLGVAAPVVADIKDVINMLHNASLILDDFQDDSPKRRGMASAHRVFGPAQAINSSSYAIVKSIGKMMEFADPSQVQRIVGRIMTLFQGQAMDLFWSHSGHCPEIESYYRMVHQKTGQLFAIAADLMMTTANRNSPIEDMAVGEFTDTLARHFQIRDDYMNLVSGEYESMKGFCEDLDEGKYSLPLIYVLKTQPQDYQLLHLLATGRKQGHMTKEQKELVLDILNKAGGMKYTRAVLDKLQIDIEKALAKLEDVFGTTNPEMALLIELLRV